MFSDLIGKKHDDVGHCGGLARIVCDRMGIDVPAWGPVDRSRAKAEIEARKGFFVKVDSPQPGDLVHIRSMDDRHHVGVVISPTHLIHSTSSHGVHTMRLDHWWLASRIIGIYRYDPQRTVRDGDTICALPDVDDDGLRSILPIAAALIAYYVIGPAAGALAAEAGFGAGAQAFVSGVATLATVTVGGMLINGASAPALPAYGRQTESPTYGWSAGANTAREGIAIPVIYGEEATWPNIINQWISVNNSTGDQWSHTLLCIAQGETNHVPTVDDISVGDQPITILPGDSYVIQTTDGGPSPGAAMTHFDKLHQMRAINKELLTATLSQILLHCNGENGSTDVIDDGVGVADDPDTTGDTEHVNAWTCHDGAVLSTAHPFIGSANLDLEGAGSYISCDEPLAFDIWDRDNWDFECRVRTDNLADDTAVIGQQRGTAGSAIWSWGIFIIGGNIVFQQFYEAGGAPVVSFNVSAAASMIVDTWYHLRVAREDSHVRIYLDGALLGSSGFGSAINPIAGSWVQTVGRAYYYNGASYSYEYGNCELDEIRLYAYGHLYDLAGFTPPVNPIADDGEQAFLTKGQVDSFSITVQCPYGCFQQLSTGDLAVGQVGLWVSFRKIGATNWVRYFVQVLATSRNPVSRQWTFEPAAGRGRYEIRISRLTWWNAIGSDNFFQTTCYLAWVDEILHESLIYPTLQLLGVSLLAQEKLSGSIPPIRVISRRTAITVPNYNGVGTRTVNPTNNAHCAFDMLTNNVYGPGISPTRPIQADWEEWSEWCDALVSGKKRCQINMAFDETYSLDEAMQNVENCGRSQIFRRGTQLAVVIDRPADGGALFCPANITPGTNHTRFLRQAERSDAVEITYRDKDLDYTDATAFATGTGFNALTRVARITRINLRGINNADQAMREAVLRQQISEATRRSVSFQSGLEAIPVTIGDVFNHAHGGRISGRLARGSAREELYLGTTVYLDRQVTLDSSVYSGNCFVVVRDPDDVMRVHTVIGPFDTPTRSITVAASATFAFLSPYAIFRDTGDVFQYRVSLMRRSGQKDVAIEANEYSENAYYHTDYDGGGTPI